MKRQLSVIVCVILFVTCACADEPGFKTTYQVNREQKTVDIVLPENPTTGFRWYLTDYQESAIESVQYHYESADNHLTGSAGFGHFLVTLDDEVFASPRRMQLDFVNLRPWEANSMPEKTSIYLYS